jgi:hypothetical protein
MPVLKLFAFLLTSNSPDRKEFEKKKIFFTAYLNKSHQYVYRGSKF